MVELINGGGSRPEPPAAWWVVVGGLECPPRVVFAELPLHENEGRVRDAEDVLPTPVMEFVAETVNTHCITM